MKPEGARRLEIVPVEFDEACAFITRFHRHHTPPQGHKFSVGVAAGGKIVGVATVGRPVSKIQQDGWTLEVTRNCADGTPNAPSALYAACRRATFALGYRRLITYLLGTEPGTSASAAGFRLVGIRRSGNWNVPSRPRVDTAEMLQGQKQLWEASS